MKTLSKGLSYKHAGEQSPVFFFSNQRPGAVGDEGRRAAARGLRMAADPTDDRREGEEG